MLITCPECQFARNINADSIPPKAQIATCPRCQAKFRFRVLPDEEAPQADDAGATVAAQQQEEMASALQDAAVSSEAVDDVLSAVAEVVEADAARNIASAEDGVDASVLSGIAADTNNVPDVDGANEVDGAVPADTVGSLDDDVEAQTGSVFTEPAVESAAAVDAKQKAAAEPQHGFATADEGVTAAEADEQADGLEADDHDGDSDYAASQYTVSEDVLGNAVDNGQPDASDAARVTATEPDNATTDSFSATSSHVVSEATQDASNEPQSVPTRRSASAQALRDRQDGVHVDTLESEEAAVQRYTREQNADGKGAAAAHIVTESDSTGTSDIWDAIAAMGEEPEAQECFIPGCVPTQHVIPWEDSRLGGIGRISATIGGMFAHPVFFWRGINAKIGIGPSLLFFILTWLIAGTAIVGWSQVLSVYWGNITSFMQPLLAQQGLTMPALVLPVLATPEVVATVLVLVVAPFAVGGITHMLAKLFGGRNAPFSTGFKSVAYSSGAFVWLLVPVLGLCLSALYLGILYVHSVRAGYNLSLRKSVVLGITVWLLVAAGAAVTALAGVPLM